MEVVREWLDNYSFGWDERKQVMGREEGIHT